MDYVFHLTILVSIYTILAISLDLVVGHAGLLSIAQGAFYGIGAYSAALVATHLGSSFWAGVVAGWIMAIAASFVVSLPSVRLRGDYLFIATFAFQLIVTGMLNNLQSVTNGPLGIANIPAPSIFGFRVQTRVAFGIVALTCALLAHLFVRRVVTSPMGRVLRCIREDEILAQAYGKNTSAIKSIIFALSAALAAVAGALYAHYVTYIDPTSFTFSESLLVLSMVIIGGSGSLVGPFAGAAVLVLLPELLRLVGLPSSTAATLRQVFYGGSLVLLMLIRPAGLFGRYGFGRKT